MIATLADAWKWYQSAQRMLLTTKRLGQKHWDRLPWEGDLAHDVQINQLDSESIIDASQLALDNLDDLCVLLLFSVFEAIVRERVQGEVETELQGIQHSGLKHAGELFIETVATGSFFKVLEPYKQRDPNLIEAVNQVRRYRNWVAHGRRGNAPAEVTPLSAFDRLQGFIDWLVLQSPGTRGSQQIEPGAPT